LLGLGRVAALLMGRAGRCEGACRSDRGVILGLAAGRAGCCAGCVGRLRWGGGVGVEGGGGVGRCRGGVLALVWLSWGQLVGRVAVRRVGGGLQGRGGAAQCRGHARVVARLAILSGGALCEIAWRLRRGRGGRCGFGLRAEGRWGPEPRGRGGAENWLLGVAAGSGRGAVEARGPAARLWLSVRGTCRSQCGRADECFRYGVHAGSRAVGSAARLDSAIVHGRSYRLGCARRHGTGSIGRLRLVGRSASTMRTRRRGELLSIVGASSCAWQERG